MSSFSSLYVVPQDSYDKYLKQQQQQQSQQSKGVFPSAKTVKVQQLNINEAEQINNMNSPAADKKEGKSSSSSKNNGPPSVSSELQRDLEEVTEHLSQVREREEARGNLLNRDVNISGAENVLDDDDRAATHHHSFSSSGSSSSSGARPRQRDDFNRTSSSGSSGSSRATAGSHGSRRSFSPRQSDFFNSSHNTSNYSNNMNNTTAATEPNPSNYSMNTAATEPSLNLPTPPSSSINDSTLSSAPTLPSFSSLLRSSSSLPAPAASAAPTTEDTIRNLGPSIEQRNNSLMEMIDELNETSGSNTLSAGDQHYDMPNFFGDDDAVSSIIAPQEAEADNTDLLFNPETIPIHSRTTTPELELIEDEDISQAIEAFPERVEEQLHQPIQQPANAAREAAAEMLNAAIANLPLRAEKLLKPRPAPYQIPKKKILPPPAWVDTPDTPNLTRAERLRTIDEAESLNLPKKAASEPSRSPKKKTYPVKQRPGKNILKKYRASKGGKSKTDDDLPPDFYQIFDETQPPKKGRKRSRTESQGEGGAEKKTPPITTRSRRKKEPKRKVTVQIGFSQGDIVDKKKDLKRKARPKKTGVPKEKKTKPANRKRGREESDTSINKLSNRKKKQTKLDDDDDNTAAS